MKTLVTLALLLAWPLLAHAVPVTARPPITVHAPATIFAEITLSEPVTIEAPVTVFGLVYELVPAAPPVWAAVLDGYEGGRQADPPLAATPEPATLLLLGGTLAGLGWVARRRRGR